MWKVRDEKILRVVRKVREVPTLPVVCSRINSLISDPKTTAKDISDVIEDDLALAAKILKVVNSAFYGFPRKIATLTHAVVILGFNEIRNIVYSISVVKLFGDSKDSRVFDHESFWKHSIAVGAAARIIASKITTQYQKLDEEAFIAGLLHDIGKIVADQFMHEEYASVLEFKDENRCSLLDAENHILGFNHQDIGFCLAEKWNLPRSLANVIYYHNTVKFSTCPQELLPIVSIVHVANSTARALDVGSGGDPFVPEIRLECVRFLKLKEHHARFIANEMLQVYAELTNNLFT